MTFPGPADLPDPAPAARPAVGRARRAGAVVAGLLALAAAQAWLTPFVAPGGQGFPFGCGSLAHPTPGALARQVCAVQGQAHVVRALVAAGAAAAVAGLAPLVARRSPAVLAGLLAAVPVLAAGLVLALSPLQVTGADGGTVGCGRPLAPAPGRFARGLCADAPGDRLGQGAALGLAALLLAAGVPWSVTGRPRPAGARPAAAR